MSRFEVSPFAPLTDRPFRNRLTTMAVRNLGPNQAELEWSATFEPDGIPANEAEQMLEHGAISANCLALSAETRSAKRSIADQDL